jgi:hypothetical protein
VLKDFLECQYGLLDHMCGGLTVEQREDLREYLNHRLKQNNILLTLLCNVATDEKWQTFLDALGKTHQKHLAAYIELDGGMKMYPSADRKLRK